MSIQALVDRGIAIRAEIKRLKAELDEIEEKLEKAGLNGPQEDLKDADREGKRYLAHGSSVVVPVIFTADKLVQSFKLNSALHSQLKTVAGEFLKDFYMLSQVFEIRFKDGKQFRTEAGKLMGASAPAFITACVARDKHGIAKSDVKVVWDEAEEV